MNSISKPNQNIGKRFNTPQILRSGLYAVWGASLLLLPLSIAGVNSQRQAIKTVGKDAAPSIITAQQLRDSFADIDASLANELLLDPLKNPKELTQVFADFEKNRKKIADRLVAAAKNITYPAEEKIVQTLQLKGSEYFLKLQEARDARKRGDKVGALTVYRSAADLVDREILPQAEKLDRVNSQELENAYNSQGTYNGAISLFIALIGLVTIGILVLIQLFIYQRMRRILNLPLLGATAIAILFLGYTLNSLVSASTNLKVAREDAFDSIHSLRQARALSYMANADESRYLLDIENKDKHEQAFNSKILKLVTLPQGQSLAAVIMLAAAHDPNIYGIPRTAEEQKFQLNGFTGFYAEQLKNITFAGELAGTIDTLRKLDSYLKIDTEIRQLARSGKIAEAIALCTGRSNDVFEEYKSANEKVRLINEKAFAEKIEAGNNNLNNFEIIASISIGSIAVLTLFGLRPRLAEYL
jgi:hypothetical protein